ncbi:cell filamentation protein Fic, partial [Pseudomonas aeruginosa]
FLDANGRSIRLLYIELSYRAGFAIDWARTRKDDYLQALDDEINNTGKGHLESYLVPSVVPIQRRDKWPEIIVQIHGLHSMEG